MPRRSSLRHLSVRKTVNCEVTVGEVVVVLSTPDVLGALVLKGAVYAEDSCGRERNLDDAAVLACAVTDPVGDRARMIGSDRIGIQALWKVLQDLATVGRLIPVRTF